MRNRNVVIGLVIGLVAVLVVVGLLVGGSLLMRDNYHRGPGMMWNSGFAGDMHNFGGGILMFVVGLPLLGLLVGGAVLLAVVLTRQGSSRKSEEETALEILKRRYARGEIDREEYERMHETLGDRGE
jgi:putative membrane protein